MATAFNMADDFEAAQAAELAESLVQDQLAVLADELQKLADEQVQRKQLVEERWLRNLRAFHGQYDTTDEGDTTDNRTRTKSKAFVKITRKKTNSWDARLGALLFPTDDENWDIRPTPVPTLSKAAKEAVEAASQQVAMANQMAQQGQVEQAAQMAAGAQANLDQAATATLVAEEALKRSMAMRDEMKDQLVECDYASECRRMIRDACRLGTGVLKGPLAGDRKRGQWLQIEGQYVYQREEDPAPVFKWVDPWSYFPDMSALKPEDREFEFERHLWSAKDLRALVRDRGFHAGTVRRILEERTIGQHLTQPGMTYLSSLRSITGETQQIKDRFIGWEYHGPLNARQIAVVLRAMGREEEAEAYDLKDDPLEEMRVIVFMCEGRILKMSPHYPLDSGESLYSIFTFEENEGSLFGYGIPEIMSDSQKSMNGAWRMALDNAALSVGPQIFIDRDNIQPANGRWDVTPRKVWYKKKGLGQGQGQIWETANVPNNVEEIMNLVETSRRFIDDETALPVHAEGELTDNPNVTATATNYMSMASNVTFRRVVKNFDDGVTTTGMRRLYDWNMQHNAREDIKGDMKVDARGSGQLLQRELTAQMLLNIAQNWSSHPVLKHALKHKGFEAVAESLRASMIQPESVLCTKEEFEASLAAEAQAAQAAAQAEAQGANADPQQNPTVIAANVRKEAAQIDAEARLQIANMQREVELMQTAQQYGLDVEKLRTMLDIKSMELEHKTAQLQTEAVLEERVAKMANEKGQTPKGSGGSISA